MAKICSSFDQQCTDLRLGGPTRIEEPGRPGRSYSILKQSNKLLKVHSSCSFKFPFAKCSAPRRTLADFACKRRASDAPCGRETLIHSSTEIVLLLLRARGPRLVIQGAPRWSFTQYITLFSKQAKSFSNSTAGDWEVPLVVG